MKQTAGPILKSPLADRMRPRVLEEYIGQSHILAPGKLLWRIIKADQPSCLIFYGPPGTGKTSLATVIAQSTHSDFLTINAVLGGVKDIRKAIDQATENQQRHKKRTILFIDEVHRFNKSQQDALLPHTENGVIIFIGATTENPYFEVNKALISRSRVFELKPLTDEELKLTLLNAVKDKERGFGKLSVEITKESTGHWICTANGDARSMLNALELAVLSSEPNADGKIIIDLQVAEESIQKKATLYDKDGDAHYDIISSFIKSLRGSDTDAALYWMARMVYAGEDPRFIFRRMVIFAAEDVGMADPNALVLVMNAAQAFDYVGMPEGRFHLSEACIYLATAPKSNSGFAFFDALDVVGKEKDLEPPNHLKDGNRDKEGLNHGKGYLYPHAYQDHWTAQQYLPPALTGRLFYEPTEQGFEKSVSKRVNEYRSMQLEMLLDSNENRETDKDYWGERTHFNQADILPKIKKILTEKIEPSPDSMFLQLNSRSAYLISDFLKKGQNQIVYAHVKNQEQEEVQRHLYATNFDKNALRIIRRESLLELLDEFAEHSFRFDFIIGKNVLSETNQKKEVLEKLNKRLNKNGILRLMEPLPQKNRRISELLDEFKMDADYVKILKKIEEFYLSEAENSKTNPDEKKFQSLLYEAGFTNEKITPYIFKQEIVLNLKKLNQLLFENSNFQTKAHEFFSAGEFKNFREEVLSRLENQKVLWKRFYLFAQANIQ